MTRHARWLMTILLACLASAWVCAQGPHIGYVYPAGGERGTTFRVTVGGQFIGGADNVYVSGTGARAEILEHVRPLNNQELNEVRTFLRELVRRRWSDQAIGGGMMMMQAEKPALPDHPWLRDLDEKSAREVERLQARFFDSRKQPNAQIGEQVEIEITIDADVAPGHRELRLMTPAGLTNPTRLQVGVLPEIREEDLSGPGATAAAPVVDLPVVLNGQVMPGEVDRFRIRAREGQQLVIRMEARQLVPYLADAVPGWFQATMALYDPSGNEVAYGDDYRFDPDPVLLCNIPEDGVYGLEVRDAIYRGRDDFVYRVTAGELPFVTQVFPLGGQAGAPTTATVSGWNLPAETLELDTDPGGAPIRLARMGEDQGLCNEIPHAVSAQPEQVETEPNNTTGDAQDVTLPLTVNGRVDTPGDVDTFSFTGRAGDELVAEVLARRLNSPLDSVLRLVDPAGKVIETNDDTDDPEMGLVTHQADSYLRATLPADGTYAIRLGDTQRKGGEAYGYRLRIGPPQPDFALRLTPSSINIGAGRSATLTVHAVRKDGFAGDISVGLKDAPAGFTLNEARIPSNEDSVDVRLTAPPNAPVQAFAMRLEGLAQIDGAPVVRPVMPAEDMMQAFLYRHLVVQDELLVAVTGYRPVPAIWRPLVPGIELTSTNPVQIPLGGTAQVRVKAPEILPDRRQSALESVRFRLAAQPRGITLNDATVVANGVVLTVKADANTALAGDSAHLIVEASTEVEGVASGGEVPRKKRVSLGVIPAIPIRVVRG